MTTTEELNIHTLKPNTVYIPSGNDYGGYNDRMAYGNFESMKKYCTTIDFMNNTSQISQPEWALKQNLELVKLNIERFIYNTELHKSRNNKDETVSAYVKIHEK